MLVFFLRRLAYGAGTLVLTAWFAYGVIRLLRPELYPGEALLSGTWSDVSGALLHFDFGGACMFFGCPPLQRMWTDGVWADLILLAGGVVVGVLLGVAGGMWCATRPRSRASRALEGVAIVFFCTPVYVVGGTLLILFAPPFGLLQLPWFFDPHSYQPLTYDPWDFIRAMVVPWVVVSAPMAAACLRLTLAIILDTVNEDYVRTATAKGLSRRLVVGRHAAPASYVSVASLFGVSAPIMVTNMVLVEYIFSVPGFFRHMKRALGQAPGWPHSIDYTTLQALAMWASVLIVALGVLADVAIMRLDPRIRAAGTPPG